MMSEWLRCTTLNRSRIGSFCHPVRTKPHLRMLQSSRAKHALRAQAYAEFILRRLRLRLCPILGCGAPLSEDPFLLLLFLAAAGARLVEAHRRAPRRERRLAPRALRDKPAHARVLRSPVRHLQRQPRPHERVRDPRKPRGRRRIVRDPHASARSGSDPLAESLLCGRVHGQSARAEADAARDPLFGGWEEGGGFAEEARIDEESLRNDGGGFVVVVEVEPELSGVARVRDERSETPREELFRRAGAADGDEHERRRRSGGGEAAELRRERACLQAPAELPQHLPHRRPRSPSP
mmetsp:Transcript_22819/g.74310  ORF Transcript_22819/g.74310 Transcript_22819/m.74310 type:complete len:294 (+) Transcript_22819:49-930(+)